MCSSHALQSYEQLIKQYVCTKWRIINSAEVHMKKILFPTTQRINFALRVASLVLMAGIAQGVIAQPAPRQIAPEAQLNTTTPIGSSEGLFGKRMGKKMWIAGKATKGQVTLLGLDKSKTCQSRVIEVKKVDVDGLYFGPQWKSKLDSSLCVGFAFDLVWLGKSDLRYRILKANRTASRQLAYKLAERLPLNLHSAEIACSNDKIEPKFSELVMTDWIFGETKFSLVTIPVEVKGDNSQLFKNRTIVMFEASHNALTLFQSGNLKSIFSIDDRIFVNTDQINIYGCHALLEAQVLEIIDNIPRTSMFTTID